MHNNYLSRDYCFIDKSEYGNIVIITGVRAIELGSFTYKY